MSAFRGQPPVDSQMAAVLLARLAVNYPQMNTTYNGVSFWTVLGEQLIDEGWSEDRVRYAVNCMLKYYKYPTFTVADILQIDKNIQTFTAAEAELLPADHRPLAMANFGDKWRICYQYDAERMNLEYKQWITCEDKKRQKGMSYDN